MTLIGTPEIANQPSKKKKSSHDGRRRAYGLFMIWIVYLIIKVLGQTSLLKTNIAESIMEWKVTGEVSIVDMGNELVSYIY